MPDKSESQSASTPPPDHNADGGVYCPFCDYDMRSRFGRACPECGEVVDEMAMCRARVPWANRREIGWFAGVWRTFRGVTFSSKKFGRAVSQPVDLREALRFRRLVVAVVWLTIVASLVGLILTEVIDLLDDYWFEQFALGWKLAGGVGVGAVLWAWLYACTGLHTYWFHPKKLSIERQNRAVALGYYACAPLLILPLAMLFCAAGLIIYAAGDELGVPSAESAGIIIVGVLGGAPLVAALLGFWSATLSLASRGAGRGVFGLVSLAAGQPLLCVVMAVLIAGLLPVTVGYAALIVMTMT
ncbi:MAG: hypothetical protein AAF911_01480 [Planctomycetota bacterium]